MYPMDRLRETRLLPVVIGLGIVAAALLLARLAHLLPPFLWAAITAYLLYPLMIRLERGLRLPRGAAIAIIFCALLGSLTILGFAVIPTASGQVRSLARATPDLIANARGELVRKPELHVAGFVLNTQQLDARIDDLGKEAAARFGREAVPLVIQTAAWVIKLIVFLLATFYFLLQGDTLLRRLRALSPARHRDTVERISRQMNETFGAYVRAQLLLFAIMTAATFAVLSVFQVEYALIVAIASGLLELVPIVGPWLAGSIAVLVTLSGTGGAFGWSPTEVALAVGISYFALRMVEDQLVVPQLIGRVVRLHPIIVIFGIMAGASLGGMLGLLLAVPVLATLRIVAVAVFEALRNPPERRVLLLQEPGSLRRVARELALYAHQHLVLLLAPGAVGWEDLETAQTLVAEALTYDIRLQAVTPDRTAASIATAAGIEVVTRVSPADESAVALEHQSLAPTPAAPGMEPRAARPAQPPVSLVVDGEP